jgi:NTE family protein
MNVHPLLLTVLLAGAVATVLGQETTQPAQTAGPATEHKHPVTALVLSGGGARGAAHIGVLRVMEQLHIVPDFIVGTSMGSIVGGLYATGWTPDQIEQLLKSIDWNNEIFSDRVERTERTFRRKQDDDILLIQGRLRFKGIKPVVPPGLLGGQRLELFLQGLEAISTGETDFDRFPIPYRAVAMDIDTGEAYVFKTGSVATAMRASMSIPGMFAAVKFDGRRLVDGGSVANLPGRIARSLGADRIIAIDISSDYESGEGQERNFLSTINALSSLLIFSNRVEDVKALQPGDVYIRPELGDLGFMAFDRAAEAVKIGESAGRAKLEALRAFASDDATWNAFLARHHRRPASELKVDEVKIVNSSLLSDETVKSMLTIPSDKPFDQKGITAAVMRLKSMDCFGLITEKFENVDGHGVLTLSTPARTLSRGSLQVGLSAQRDSQSNQDVNLTFRLQLLALNRLAGEAQAVAQIGQSQDASFEYYQPVEATLHWFVTSAVDVQRKQRQIWSDGDAVAEYRTRHEEVSADFGRVLGQWGEVRLGVYTGNEGADRTIGAVGPETYSESRGGIMAKFTVDTADQAVFARQGNFVQLSFDQSSHTLGADTDYQRTYLVANHFFSWGANTLQPGIEIGVNLDTPVSYMNEFTLGGPGRLSGLAVDELAGDDAGLARVVYYRRVAGLDLSSMRIRTFIGGTLETGNVYDKGDPVTMASLRFSGSVFVGADTPIGPIYLGWGLSEGGRDRIYISFGRRL